MSFKRLYLAMSFGSMTLLLTLSGSLSIRLAAVLFSIFIIYKKDLMKHSQIIFNKLENLFVIICLISFSVDFYLTYLDIFNHEKILSVISYNALATCLLLATLSCACLAFYALRIILISMYRCAKNIILDVWKKSNKESKILFFIACFVFVFIYILVFNETIGFSENYDVIYSIDSSYVKSTMLKKGSYATIQHLFVAFPYFLIRELSSKFDLLLNSKSILLICMQIFMLGFCSLILWCLTHSRWVQIIFLISFPTMLFSFMVEKYQICVLTLLLYVYAVIMNRRENKMMFFMTVGTISINAFMGIVISKKDNIIDRIYDFIKVALEFLSFLILIGRAGVIQGLLLYPNQLEGYMTSKTFYERFLAYTNMIGNCLFRSPYQITETSIWWINNGQYLNVLGFLLLFLCLGNCLTLKKNSSIINVGLLWILFSFVLLVLYGWASNESPLFSILFSWSYIVCGCNIIEKTIINKKLKNGLFILFSLIMIWLNFSHMFEIFVFLERMFG